MTIEEYYKKLAPRLTNWLVSSGSSYHEACDIVQSTFLKLWQMRDDLVDSEESVSGLVFTIARNLRKNLARDNSRMTFTDEVTEDAAVSAAPATLPSDNAYLRRRLVKAFASLPPVLRETYTMFQVGERSIREIAAETGVSENLVKVRIFRAKEKLKEILKDLM